MPVKTYETKRHKQLADGTIREYVVTNRYQTKGKPGFSPEQVAEILGKVAAHIPKKIICEEYKISSYLLNKIIKEATDDLRNRAEVDPKVDETPKNE